jgi:hypothetical protein
MPVHDWTRVTAGIFHHFHHDWITALSRTLNHGLLPAGYYALAEQVAGGLEPDVLALEQPPSGPPAHQGNGAAGASASPSGGLAITTAPPQVRFTASVPVDPHARKRSRVATRHSSDDRVVALIEIVSPGIKGSEHALRSFVNKAVEFLEAGVHLLILDLFPPGPRDPQGIHGAIWSQFSTDVFQLPQDKPLTLVAYAVGRDQRAYVEPVAVGDALADMPLFLEPELYVPVPLEAAYRAAFDDVPLRWRRVLEPPAGAGGEGNAP